MGVTRIRSIEALKRLHQERHVKPLEGDKQKVEMRLAAEKRAALNTMYKELVDRALMDYPMLRPRDVCAFKRGDYSANVDTSGFSINLVIDDAEFWDTIPKVRDAMDTLARVRGEIDTTTKRIADWEFDATLAIANRGKVPDFKG